MHCSLHRFEGRVTRAWGMIFRETFSPFGDEKVEEPGGRVNVREIAEGALRALA